MKRKLAWLLCLALLLGALPLQAFSALADEATDTIVMARSVQLSKTTAKMDLNGKNQGRMRVTVSPANANETLKWATSNPKVATVDETGLITAHGTGTCTIGVRGANTPWAKRKVIVVNTGASKPTTPTPPASTAKPVVTLRVSSQRLDINGQASAKLSYNCSVSGAKMEWVTSNPKVATVSESGIVTAVGVGTCVIGARAEGGKWAKCKVTVVNSAKPTSLKVPANTIVVAPGASVQVEASVLPEKADQRLYWKVANSSIATVDQQGNVRGIKKGTTYVRVYSAANKSIYKTLTVSVSVNAPTSIQLEQSLYTVAKGATFMINAKAMPETAEQGLKYVSSNTKVATVTSKGQVKAVGTGKAVIRIYSAESSAIFTAIGVKVSANAPTSISFGTAELFFAPGDSVTLQPTVLPSGAQTGIKYVSSDATVASVDATGKLRAIAPGTARITATTDVGSLSAGVNVTVLSTDYTTVVPARYTSVSGIKANLAKIDAVAQSAYNALDTEIKTGSLTANEAAARKVQIRRAFAMYRFPWLTRVDQPYWRASSSLGGAKDFRANRVYYGLPYIQCGKSGDFNARRFNEANAVSGGYYTDSGNGYYVMSQTKKFDGMYAGNDCSSFLSMAMWGLGNAYSYDYTSNMLVSYAYKTVPWTREMMPGDMLIVDGHCVMFLYYTNSARTQMMIIEQGGGNSSDIHNTVCCSVVNVAAYRSAGYIIRRPASYAG